MTTKGMASTVCDKANPNNVFVSPILAKKKKIPTVDTMTGITMGEMISMLIGPLSRIFDFTNATAAGTPMISEKTVHIDPTTKLCQMARIHFWELKISSYH